MLKIKGKVFKFRIWSKSKILKIFCWWFLEKIFLGKFSKIILWKFSENIFFLKLIWKCFKIIWNFPKIFSWKWSWKFSKKNFLNIEIFFLSSIFSPTPSFSDPTKFSTLISSFFLPPSWDASKSFLHFFLSILRERAKEKFFFA